ncbi:MAG: hypothetical protein D4R97_05065, partial [Bacteroidetes bacterium]
MHPLKTARNAPRKKRKKNGCFFMVDPVPDIIFPKSYLCMNSNQIPAIKVRFFSVRMRSVKRKMEFKNRIFEHLNEGDFNATALDIFRFQYERNEIYRRYTDAIGLVPGKISHYSQIPFLPVSFFKTYPVVSGISLPEKIFLSSGTTSAVVSTGSTTGQLSLNNLGIGVVVEPVETTTPRSRHLVTDLSIYDE